MLTVTGANLFGQWLCDEPLFEGFKGISNQRTSAADNNFDLSKAKLVQVNWSYNIFEVNGVFYISGCWKGKPNQLVPVSLPEGLVKDPRTHLMMAGNDHYLIVVEAEKQTVWIIDLKFEEPPKKLNLITERPAPQNVSKKRRSDQILKVATTNTSYMYLTCLNRGTLVYSGLLPSLLDTRHCEGHVIDVQCGYEHFILLTDIGKVYTWGNGRRLQLGHGDLINLDLPTEVRALSGMKIVKVRAGGWHSAVLSECGDLYTWGWNDRGQLGIKESEEQRNNQEGRMRGIKTYIVPTVIDIFNEDGEEIPLDVLDMACGSRHTAILLEDNSIWTSGCNKYGQLGLPKSYEKVDYFVKVHQGSSDSYLRCGPWSTVVIK